MFSFQSAFIYEKVLRDRIVLYSPFYTWDYCASASWCWNYRCSTPTILEDWFARKFNFIFKQVEIVSPWQFILFQFPLYFLKIMSTWLGKLESNNTIVMTKLVPLSCGSTGKHTVLISQSRNTQILHNDAMFPLTTKGIDGRANDYHRSWLVSSELL